jgi:hypothetical protein
MKRIIETTFNLRRSAPVLRRGFLQTAAGAVLGAGPWMPARADDKGSVVDRSSPRGANKGSRCRPQLGSMVLICLLSSRASALRFIL